MDTEFEEIQIPVPWGNLAGKWWGPKTKQPVLAIHGWQDNAGTFDTLAPLLWKNHDISVLCIDLPGHGFSSHIPVGQQYYIFWDGVYIVRRIVQHYKWNDVTLLGHSLGGAISFLYAAIYPDEIKKYVSIDIAAPIVKDVSKTLDVIGESIDRFLKYEKLSRDLQPCYNYEEMLDVVEDAYKGAVTKKSCEILMKRGMKPCKNGEKYLFSRDVRLKVSSLCPMSLEQVFEMAPRIKCEVLNIRADPGMKFDKPEYYNGVIDMIVNAKRKEFHTVPGSHHLHLNNPDRVIGIISSFLKS